MRALLVIILFAVVWTNLSPAASAHFKGAAIDRSFMPLLGLQTDFRQVRFDQRVIVRFPAPGSIPATMGTQRQSVGNIRYKEKKIGKCLLVNRLGGSRQSGFGDAGRHSHSRVSGGRLPRKRILRGGLYGAVV